MIEEQAIQRTKVTIWFPTRLWVEVERMAREDGVSRTEFLRRSIGTEQFRRQVRDEGGKHLVQRADGELERVRFPY